MNPCGTHLSGNITRQAEAPITTRYLLGKKGTNPALQAVVAGAADIPDFVITDEAEVAGDPIGCAVLGNATGTVQLIAAAAIDAAAVNYLIPAASGKVQPLPDPAAEAATFYVVGKPLTSAAADGDPLEVAHCTPFPITVPASA